MKAEIVRKIRETDDTELLGEVFRCLEKHFPREKTILSPELMEQLDKDIEQSRKDYAEGRCISNEERQKRLAQWLESQEK